MAELQNEFRIVRVVDLDAGFQADEDWVATNDIQKWRDLGNPGWWKPTGVAGVLAGRTQYMTAFQDGPTVHVASVPGTRIDIELVELIHTEGNAIAQRLVVRGPHRRLDGDSIFEAPTPLSFPGNLGTRLVGAHAIPDTATLLYILGRVV